MVFASDVRNSIAWEEDRKENHAIREHYETFSNITYTLKIKD